MRSLNTNFLAAFAKARVRPRFRVEITTDAATVNTLLSVADNGSGKCRFTLSATHDIAPAAYVRILHNSYASENELVTAVTSGTTFDTAQDFDSGTATGVVYTRESWFLLSGSCDQIDESESVASITPISRELDPLKRSLKADQVTMILHLDSKVRDIEVNYGLAKKNVHIYLGAAELAAGDFEDFFSGQVTEARPDSGNRLVLTIKSLENFFNEYTYRGPIFPDHPVLILRRIIHELCGRQDTRMDLATFDPDNDLTTSHWVVSRLGVLRDGYTDRTLMDPVPGKGLAEGLVEIMGGSVKTNAAGELAYRAYDPTTADDDWTEDDFSHFKVVDLYKKLHNRVEIKSHAYGTIGAYSSEHPVARGSYESLFTLEDVESQRGYSYVTDGEGWTDHVPILQLQSDWISASAYLLGDWLAGTPASETSPGAGDGGAVLLGYGEVYSMCGFRWPMESAELAWRPTYPDGSQDASALITAARPAYIRVDEEIIELDVCTPSGNQILQYTSPTRVWDNTNAPVAASCRVKNRGVFGSAAAAHTYDAAHFDDYFVAEAIDVTIPAAWASRLLPRYVNGLWRVSCRTGLSKMANEVGDILTLTTDQFVAKGVDGLDTATRWEITGKKEFVGEGYIEWVMVLAERDSPPALDTSTDARRSKGQFSGTNLQSAFMGQDFAKAKVISGFGFTDVGSAFQGDLDSGVVGYVSGRKNIVLTDGAGNDGLSITFTASKDTYVIADGLTGSIPMLETTIGAGVPEIRIWQVLLWKISTDGSDITAMVDLRDGAQLVDDVVTESSINDLAVTAGKLGAESVTEGKIYPGAVTNPKIGLKAVDTAELADSAVEEAKVASSAITTVKVANYAIGADKITADNSGRNFNWDFNDWSPG